MIAHLADLHLRGKDLQETEEQLDEVLGAIESKEIHVVTVSGDVFDSTHIGDKHVYTGGIMETAIGFFLGLAQDRQVIVVSGNHDQDGPSVDSAVKALGGIPGIRIVTTPRIIDAFGVQFLSVPWLYGQNAEEIVGDLWQNREKGKRTCLIGHAKVEGVLMRDGVHCRVGANDFSLSDKFLTKLCLDGLDHVALGEIHRRQRYFVGAIRQCNFGEEGNPQGFEVWHTDEDEIEWVECNSYGKHITLSDADTAERHHLNCPSDKIRVRYHETMPDEATLNRMEAINAQVEVEVETPERVIRIEIPQGVTKNSNALIEMWCKAQSPAIPDEEIRALKNIWGRIQSGELTDG